MAIRWQNQHQSRSLLLEPWSLAISGTLTTGGWLPDVPSQLHGTFPLAVGHTLLATPGQKCHMEPSKLGPYTTFSLTWSQPLPGGRMETAPTSQGAGLVVKWMLQDRRCLLVMAGMSGDRAGPAPVLLLWLGWQCSTLLCRVNTEPSLATPLVLPPQASQSDTCKE